MSTPTLSPSRAGTITMNVMHMAGILDIMAIGSMPRIISVDPCVGLDLPQVGQHIPEPETSSCFLTSLLSSSAIIVIRF
jgi:hypothetical protein